MDTTDFFPDPFPGSGGAHGSGCVTPGFDALPNGVWYGFAEGVGGGNITFDLACFYTGPAACDAQIEDGFVTDAADCLDFWVRNNVATTFSVPLAAGARVWYVDMTSGDVTSPDRDPPGGLADPRLVPGLPQRLVQRVAVRERRTDHRHRRAVPAVERGSIGPGIFVVRPVHRLQGDECWSPY